MPVYLLLSSDASLQAELESSLGGLQPKPTLIQSDSWDGVREYMRSLRDVEALLVDANQFEIPGSHSGPILLLGGSEHLRRVHPGIDRPFYPESLSFALEQLRLKSAEPSDPASAGAYEFLCNFLQLVVHDLNNQMTTLHGNLPFLEELIPEEADTLSDMKRATERSIDLLRQLEAVDPDMLPVSTLLSVKDLVEDFIHFAKKMYPGTLSPVVQDSVLRMHLRGDSGFLCCMLLQLLWLYGPAFPDLQVEVRSPDDDSLQILFTPLTSLWDEEGVKLGLKQLKSRYQLTQLDISFSAPTLLCTFSQK
ncbi:MAG: hypothetical protein ACO3N7_06695 [Kiritimatiellia bacterium]